MRGRLAGHGAQRSHTGHGVDSSLGSSFIQLNNVLNQAPSWAGALHEDPLAVLTNYPKLEGACK